MSSRNVQVSEQTWPTRNEYLGWCAVMEAAPEPIIAAHLKDATSLPGGGVALRVPQAL